MRTAIVKLGLEPTRLISAMKKLTRFNEGKGVLVTASFYSALDERVKFCKAMIEMVRERASAPALIASK